MFRLSGHLLGVMWVCFFIGFLCNSDMFLACGETGDTGQAEQKLLFHWFSLYFLYPGLWDLAYGIRGLGSRSRI